MKTTSATRCSVQLKGLNFCDAPSVEDAPFPICERHMIQIVRFVMSGPRATDAIQNRGDAERIRTQRAHQRSKSVVYYIDMGNDKIKIGRSARLAGRLETLYREVSDVLAVEIGGAKTEAYRHKQFAADRIGKTENFTASTALKRHVTALATEDNALTVSEALRQQTGTAVYTGEHASPLLNWL